MFPSFLFLLTKFFCQPREVRLITHGLRSHVVLYTRSLEIGKDLCSFLCCAFKSCRNAKEVRKRGGVSQWKFWEKDPGIFARRCTFDSYCKEVGGGLSWIRPVIGLQNLLRRQKAEIKNWKRGVGGGRPSPLPPQNHTYTQAWKQSSVTSRGGSLHAKGKGNRCRTRGTLHHFGLQGLWELVYQQLDFITISQMRSCMGWNNKQTLLCGCARSCF